MLTIGRLALEDDAVLLKHARYVQTEVKVLKAEFSYLNFSFQNDLLEDCLICVSCLM